ncbi:hypothetical protein PV325_011593 [Microctonus aethiopoides]|nr:hypothetical protein PV325_011593 [Microctonus aethiopoides]
MGVKVGELVWGAALGSPAWPGKVESLGPTGSLTVWVRWYGVGGTLTQVDIKSLKSLSDGLEAHHRARKRFRKSRKLNMQLENAIQEAMAELDNITSDKHAPRKIAKQLMKSNAARSSKSATSTSTLNGARCLEKKTSKKLVVADSQKTASKCR